MDASKELQGILKVLADQFGTTVNHLWNVLVKQQMIDSITTISIIAIVGIICILSAIVFIWYTRKYANELVNSGESVLWIPATISGTIAIVTGILFVIAIPIYFGDIATGFINPDYGALMDILEKLSNS